MEIGTSVNRQPLTPMRNIHMETTTNKPTVIWLATEECLPFEHIVEGVCDCKSCEGKKSRIILTQ
jgi:hypothetical protein